MIIRSQSQCSVPERASWGRVYVLERREIVLARSRRRKPVVLVVEDEPTIRALAESNIADIGFETLSAGNGREALALLDEGASIDILFTDINLPDGPDGIELARQVAEAHPSIRVVYTTGGGLTDGMRALFVEGAIFLQKPYARDQLIEAVRSDTKPVKP